MQRVSILLFTCLASVSGGTYPPGFAEAVFAVGLNSPTAMAFAPDGRLFVCEQGGSLRVVKNGALLPAPFLTVNVNSLGERGLLGVAFDPDFTVNGYVYVYYTTAGAPIHNRVSRFTANGDVAVPASELAILDLENLSATNHNGGAIHFGPDGKLYVGVGENANAPNAQSFGNRLGKLLRVNSDGTVPADNPFVLQTTGVNQAIWAMGLRNPFTFAFHPGNGRLHINDVGAGLFEEINEGIAGSNYGWPAHEGFDGGNAAFRDPLIAYGHSGAAPTGCAISGGAFLTGSVYPAQYSNAYFYADFCGRWIYYSQAPNYTSAAPLVVDVGNGVVDLQVWNGELYYLIRDIGEGNGAVIKITYTPPRPGLQYLTTFPGAASANRRWPAARHACSTSGTSPPAAGCRTRAPTH